MSPTLSRRRHLKVIPTYQLLPIDLEATASSKSTKHLLSLEDTTSLVSQLLREARTLLITTHSSNHSQDRPNNVKMFLQQISDTRIIRESNSSTTRTKRAVASTAVKERATRTKQIHPPSLRTMAKKMTVRRALSLTIIPVITW